MSPFSDRLADAVRRKGPLCVGLDPRWESLPKEIRERVAADPIENERIPAKLINASVAFAQFAQRVLELVEPYCGIVKPQAAFYELTGTYGLHTLAITLQNAKEMGFVTILDAKRGDIASTAEAYADAAFGGCTIDGTTFPVWDADALTINPYLGRDAVEPFLTVAKAGERGVFVLVRTSNPGSGMFQDLNCDGKPLYRHVAAEVAKWNASTIGECGLGDVGAVVGATHPRELAELRAELPNVWFLVPGYGAQGGTAADVKAAYRADGLGAIVNSSRGVTFPFQPDDPDWEAKIVSAGAEGSGGVEGVNSNAASGSQSHLRRCHETASQFFFGAGLGVVTSFGGFGSLPRITAYFTCISPSVAFEAGMLLSRMRLTSTMVPGVRSEEEAE